MAEEKTAVAKAALTTAQVVLTALGILKELFITAMAFLVQYERIKAKKTEDQLELMKSDKRADDAVRKVEKEAANTSARSGIDKFLSE